MNTVMKNNNYISNMYTDEQIKAFAVIGDNDLEIELRFQFAQDIIKDWLDLKPNNKKLDFIYKSYLQLFLSWLEKNKEIGDEKFVTKKEKRKLAELKHQIKKQYEQLQD